MPTCASTLPGCGLRASRSSANATPPNGESGAPGRVHPRRILTENCLNCGEVLRGQHCSHCGQRAKVRVLSLGTLLRDLLGDITNFDSRIWRTLKPLAFSPGTLTVEYLRGRHTHYSPPFRMYLILSVAFFLLTTVGGNPGDALNFEVGNDGNGGANMTVGSGELAPPAGGQVNRAAPARRRQRRRLRTAPKLDPQRQRIVDEIVKRIPDQADRAKARAELEQEFGAMTPEQVTQINGHGRSMRPGKPQDRHRARARKPKTSA